LGVILTNLSLIDRPKTIATLEYYDISLCLVAAAVIVFPFMFASVMFLSAYPFVALGMGVWIREKKRGKAFGYLQRLFYKKYREIVSGKRIIYVNSN
jgi:hypothetical protein